MQKQQQLAFLHNNNIDKKSNNTNKPQSGQEVKENFNEFLLLFFFLDCNKGSAAKDWRNGQETHTKQEWWQQLASTRKHAKSTFTGLN